MEQYSSLAPQDDERLVIIPRNWREERVVPIYIRTIDDQGLSVFRGWIDAVFPIANSLRRLTRRILGEPWQVSELTEGSVHALNREHGSNLGRSPSAQVLANAAWHARDIQAGGRRLRDGRDVLLNDYLVDHLLDPNDFEQAYLIEDLKGALEAKLWEQGKPENVTMFKLHAAGAAKYIPDALGVKPNSRERNKLSQGFRRSIKKAWTEIQEEISQHGSGTHAEGKRRRNFF